MRYMKKKTKIKIGIDILMCILLLWLMSFQYTGQKNHEIAAALMLALFFAHHVLNFPWYRSIVKGAYSGRRILTLITDILFFILTVLLMISGIGMSRYVFRFPLFNVSQSLARSLHMTTSFSFFLLTGFHLGQHWGIILAMIKKAMRIKENSSIRTQIARCTALGISIYGIIALIHRNIFDYITLQAHFILFDADEPVIFYELDLLAIVVLMVFIGYYLQMLLNKYMKKRKGDQH